MKARTAASFVVFCILAVAVACSISFVIRLMIAESQLQTYVPLAAKSHASLNFERGVFHLLAAESATDTARLYDATNKLAVDRIPVVSKWDELYITCYNERMTSLLSSSNKHNSTGQATNDAADANSSSVQDKR